MILVDPLARPVIAHRGASGRFPENTLLAFREARRAGADAVEFDVRRTADGVAVVIHDADVDRTTNGAGAVAALSAAAVRDLDAGNGERIPELVDVLEDIGPMPAIVEIKEVSAAPLVVSGIERAGAGNRVVVGSFDRRALEPARRAGLMTLAGRRETVWAWARSRLGLPRRRPPYRAFSLPEYRDHLRVVDPRFVRTAHRAGLPVHVWTVDDPADARRLRAIGVAGIVTNFPERMVGT